MTIYLHTMTAILLIIMICLLYITVYYLTMTICLLNMTIHYITMTIKFLTMTMVIRMIFAVIYTMRIFFYPRKGIK